ncbi:hypothetical protein J1N35_034307, partial [Gossypium stocksii]
RANDYLRLASWLDTVVARLEQIIDFCCGSSDFSSLLKEKLEKLLPTCQSLGEVYLRLEHYKNALSFLAIVVAEWLSGWQLRISAV